MRREVWRAWGDRDAYVPALERLKRSVEALPEGTGPFPVEAEAA